ncbi:MAG: NAD(P)/FAD-dependent oxidoreductase [Deltaproteobacteria bacterium]|nr:NAD(P)/FAD-dependent oxidoreductase [Deltaproteobacteria bacterium]MBW2420647.1 NAD(P)/FAD-dependent oxidoreductase [Deltaproteobacteria bacterium]
MPDPNTDYDVIIVGAGHNGLVTAGYLAKAGRRVLVLERRDRVGGAAVTEELFPGFRFSSCADGSGYLCDEVRRDLKPEVEILAADPVVFAPQPDGSRLAIWRDPAKTAAEIAPFSSADAERYPAFVELVGKIAAVVGGLARVEPPDIPEVGLRDLLGLRPLAGPVRALGRKHVNDLLRVLPMPVADLLDEWFESEVVKGAIAANGVRDITWGPKESGTAYALLYNWSLSDTGLLRSSGVVKGGMGALSEALATAARSFGAEIRTGAVVEGIATEEKRALGVKLAGGTTLRAPVIVSNADPRTTFLELLDPYTLGARFVRHVRNIKYRGSAARVLLALGELPEFSALAPSGSGAGGDDSARLMQSPIQIAPTLDYLQRAYDCTKYGEFSTQPYLDVMIPTLLDPSLAPEGQHVMSITAKYAPYRLRDGDWETRREAFGDVVIDTLAEYAPRIRDAILHRRVLTPPDLEAAYGLPEGNPSHGEMTLDQFFHMRPIPGYARYRTPIGGLYLCGAGCHPGGGVTGIPGHNAARAILAD